MIYYSYGNSLYIYIYYIYHIYYYYPSLHYPILYKLMSCPILYTSLCYVRLQCMTYTYNHI